MDCSMKSKSLCDRREEIDKGKRSDMYSEGAHSNAHHGKEVGTEKAAVTGSKYSDRKECNCPAVSHLKHLPTLIHIIEACW